MLFLGIISWKGALRLIKGGGLFFRWGALFWSGGRVPYWGGIVLTGREGSKKIVKWEARPHEPPPTHYGKPCKGVVKFNFSDLFAWGHFQRSWKWMNRKIVHLNLIAVTRIINLSRCISELNCFKFPIYMFYFRPSWFFKKQVICWD